MKIEIKKEIANAITHGIGFVTFATLLPLLFIKASHYDVNYKLVGLIFFAIGLVAVYLSSTIYHSLTNERAKYILRIADHISIYYLIAGTYTALLMQTIPFNKIMWFIIILWSVVLIGTIKKIFLTGKYDTISTIIYVVMGCMGLFQINTIMKFTPDKVLLFILLGGIAYLLGVIFYAWKKFTYHHAVWHLFVLAGSIMHFFGVWYAIEKP
ncbi:MAG: hemolysin III family protein [Chitinophagales bacterium]|nr:hemolysin III family protein [Chitinophagales bacterium]HMV13937.1 hemolysin III family protein [Chitinophagales bacterium]HMW12288.1 hemolysin III family protein [Chitinophagales bacterium]HMX58965.1 hemolysin III family protein [Chitinophagales bacterium]HMY22655.1 hemolysin III family protein [Chitinophagales bacterium]